MDIRMNKEDSKLTVEIEGRLDTLTSPDLEKELNPLDGITELCIDCKELEYISSAGLRVLLSLQKTMNKQGKMTLTNVRQEVMEVFELTGFTDILHFA